MTGTFSVWILVTVYCGFVTPDIPLVGMGPKTIQTCFATLLARYAADRAPPKGPPIITRFDRNGLTSFLAAKYVANFAIKDVHYSFVARFGGLEPDIRETNPSLAVIPIMAQPLVIVYNIPTAPEVFKMTAQQFLDLFCGKVLDWNLLANKPFEIVSDTQPVTVWVRDEARTSSTKLMRQLIAAYAKKLNHNTGYENCLTPGTSPYSTVLTSYGQLGAVSLTPYSVGFTGYLEYKISEDRETFAAAYLENDEGGFANPEDKEAIVESMQTSKLDENSQADLILPRGKKAYPLGGFLYLIVRKTSWDRGIPLDCSAQSELIRFIRWIVHSKNASEVVTQNHFTPLPPAVFETVIKNTLMKMRCGPHDSVSVWNKMVADIRKETAKTDFGLITGIIVGVIAAMAVFFKLIWIIYDKRMLQYLARMGVYTVPEENIKIIKASKEKYEQMMHFRKYLEGRHSLPEFVVGEYRADVVMLKHAKLIRTQVVHSLRVRFVQMLRNVRHINVVQFFGLTEHSAFQSKYFIISQFCPLGDLRTALDNKRNELDPPIKFGMAKGVVEGLYYLHSNNIIHGNLRSAVIYLEADWTTRIADWEFTEIELLQHNFRNRERIVRAELTKEEEHIYLPPLLWSAPEILNAVYRGETYIPTKECDVFSFSIILFEILTRELPYEYQDVPVSMSFEYLFALIRRNESPLRPLDFKELEEIGLIIPVSIYDIIKSAWAGDPIDRPAISEVRRVLLAVSSEMKRLADLTIVNTRAQIEHFKRNIIRNSEETVELRKVLEHTQVDFLTRWAYDSIMEGAPVEPKFYQVAYILHCSLVNYDGLCGTTHGDAVLYFVNRFYQIVDFLLPRDRNIHKLHSNGDDITIFAAIPSGGVEYASKIANLALDLLCAVWKADLLDIDWGRMEIRVGLACGPVVAGIYGNAHREFTVFGVARDESLEMESSSYAYHILITEAFYEALKMYPDFKTRESVEHDHSFTDFKKAYWLTGKENYKQQDLLDKIDAAYPIEHGHHYMNQENIRQIKERQKLQPARLSVPPPPGSYVQRDARSGYLIEHYDRNIKEDTEGMIVAKAPPKSQKNAKSKAAQGAELSPSQMFGSMLGPQGFSAYEEGYEEQKMKRKEKEEDKIDLDSAFIGQLGIRRLSLAPVEDDKAKAVTPDMYLYDISEADLMDEVVQPDKPDPTISIAERVQPQENNQIQLETQAQSEDSAEVKRRKKRKRKHASKKRRKPSVKSMMRKTSLWVDSLPDPADALPPEDKSQEILVLSGVEDVEEDMELAPVTEVNSPSSKRAKSAKRDQ